MTTAGDQAASERAAASTGGPEQPPAVERRRPVAADVAKAVGVSKTTVSYVFSDDKRHKISAETVERVLAEADRIGFRPNRVARALRTGQRNTVLAVLPDWDMGPSWSSTLQEFSDLLAEQGYAFSAVSGSTTTRLWEDLAPGIVVALVEVGEELAAFCAAEGIPLIDSDMHTMLHNAGEAGAAALHRAGHERIGYLLPPPPIPREIWEFRFEGIVDYCRRAGLPAPERATLDVSEDGIPTLRREWLEAADPVTGVISHNDDIGVYLHVALQRAGFDVSRIGILGAGDRPIARLGLSTLAGDQTGTTAEGLLAGVLAGVQSASPEPFVVRWSTPRIIYRDSLPAPS